MSAHSPTRRPHAKRRATPSPAAPRSGELSSFTEEWWSSWRRANALGWEYLNAVSGLVRLNMNAFSRSSSLFVPPFAQ